MNLELKIVIYLKLDLIKSSLSSSVHFTVLSITELLPQSSKTLRFCFPGN